MTEVSFALLHATRGRPDKALEVHDHWMDRCVNPDNVRYCFGVDEDDLETLRVLRDRNLAFVSGISDGCFGAYNRAFSLTPGQVIVPVEDDLWAPARWDEGLAEAVGEHASDPAAIFVNDGGNDRIAYFFTRALTEKWGHLYPPGYFGVFGDTELRDRIAADPEILRIDASHMTFDQRHWSRGMALHDSVYVRKEGYWSQDQKHYYQRRMEGGW